MEPRRQEPTPGSERIFLGLGSNLGDRAGRIESALAWLGEHSDIELVAATRCLETEPWGMADQPAFLNAVAEIRTKLEPEALLAELQSAELALGRCKEGRPRWGPREIDIDILLFGDRVVSLPDLVIPHPRLTERTFVLLQLLELDPRLSHPTLGRSISSYI
jgi:2-amino-4-hydroxy-6-hydroxymethyldihydropteridine diphosphokinase